MALSNRHKLTVAALLIYWCVLFVLTHIPIPQIFFGEMSPSDKTLHYFAYLVLSFLLWFAIGAGEKVNWRKAAVWWALFAVVWYGVFDEWLQGYVGRNPDIRDFFADFAGAVTGLIVLSIFPLRPVSLVLTGAVIFVLTNFVQAGPAEQLPVISGVFYLLAYAFFSVLWVRYMHYCLPIRAPQPKWVAGAIIVPVMFLSAVSIFCVIAGSGLSVVNAVVSAAGIAAAVITIYLIALFRPGITDGL